MPQTRRIDSHHHLWRYTPEDYGWIDEAMASLRRDFLLAELRSALDDVKVQGTVAVQARQTVEETDFLLQCAGQDGSPVVGVVGWLPIADERFPALLEQYAAQDRLCGLRHVVQGEPDGFLDSGAFNRGVQALRGTGLSYDILIYARQLDQAIRFVDRHPDQQFVLDHLAKPVIRSDGFDQWSGGFRELAKRPNVACKVSGMVTEADWHRWTRDQLAPYFETALHAFGPERLMIGTDWPVLTLGCSYAQWWHIVEDWIRPLSADERAAILGGTAVRVYRLLPEDSAPAAVL